MKTRMYVLGLIAAVLVLSGCGTTAKFVYPSRLENLKQVSEQPKHNLTVAVLPFEEQRTDTNSSGKMWLYLIPLVSLGKIHYERPEAARMFLSVNEFDFDVSEDLAKAAVTSLKHSGLFKDVYFTYGGDRQNADIVVTGQVTSTLYEADMYSYGTSVFCPYLWMVGLPMGKSYNNLAFNIVAQDQRTDRVIMQHTYSGSESIKQGLYYSSGYDVKSYVNLMEQGMNEVIDTLDRSLSNR